MNEITKENFLKMYGNEEVTFQSYYKYTFNYSGRLKNGSRIVIGYGGDSEDIYRHEVEPSITKTVRAIDPCFGHIYRNNRVIHKFDTR